MIAAWNGHAWKLQHSPITDGSLFSLAAISASDVWAVGGSGNQGLILRWNGKRWTGFAFSAP